MSEYIYRCNRLKVLHHVKQAFFAAGSPAVNAAMMNQVADVIIKDAKETWDRTFNDEEELSK